MRKIQALCFFLAGLCVIALPFAQANAAAQDDGFRTIAVQGRGASSGAPDQATIEIGITTPAKTAREAQRENARVAKSVQDHLLALGIKQDKLHTARYIFHPVYSNEKNKENEITGYQVNNTVVVTVDDLSLLGAVIDSSIHNGANTIDSIHFTKKNNQSVKQEALQAAAKDAKEKARVIAEALNQRVVGIVRVNENGISLESRSMGNYVMDSSAAGVAQKTPLQAGTVNVTANVEIIFEIQPKS